MIADNMRLAAFPPHIPQDVPVPLFDLAAEDSSRRLYPDAPTALHELESEGVEGCAINWGLQALGEKIRDCAGACAIMSLGQGGGSAGE